MPKRNNYIMDAFPKSSGPILFLWANESCEPPPPPPYKRWYFHLHGLCCTCSFWEQGLPFHRLPSAQAIAVTARRMYQPLCRRHCFLRRKSFYSIGDYRFMNCAAVMIFGVLIPDSRKSLSPVSNMSASAWIAALRIERSKQSLIKSSLLFSSSGTGTTSRTRRAVARKRSRDSILEGNFR